MYFLRYFFIGFLFFLVLDFPAHAKDEGHPLLYYKAVETYRAGNHQLAFQYFKHLAETLGDTESMYMLGIMYFNGQGTTKDIDYGARWFQTAAKRNHTKAQYQLALVYYSDKYGLKNHREALRLFKDAARGGSEDAQYYLGVVALENNSVQKAFDWFKKAAEHGHTHALYELANLYQYHPDIPTDAKVMAALYLQAAKQGHSGAMLSIATLYDEGRGIDQDFENALNWYQKSALAGETLAGYYLGRMYRDGRGVTTDRETAYIWYNVALLQMPETHPARNRVLEESSQLIENLPKDRVDVLRAQAKNILDTKILKTN